MQILQTRLNWVNGKRPFSSDGALLISAEDIHVGPCRGVDEGRF